MHVVDNDVSERLEPDRRIEYSSSVKPRAHAGPRTSASHLNRIECHFRPLREFVLNASDYPNHSDVAVAFRRYLRRRNTDHQTSRIRLLEVKIA